MPPTTFKSPRTVPAIVFHGDLDTTVHPRNGDQVVAQLRENSNTDLRVTVQHGRVPGARGYSRTLYHDARGQVIFEQWIIHGAGHAWSGGSLAGSYTDPQGPDATREILSVLSRASNEFLATLIHDGPELPLSTPANPLI